jgi:flagellin-like hook-associated protein FlgL
MGERSFINIGNVNSANSDDWTDNSDVSSRGIINKIYTSDDAVNAKTFTAGPIAVGDYVWDDVNADGVNSLDGVNDIVYEATTAIDQWDETTAALGINAPTTVFYAGNYYTAPAAIDYSAATTYDGTDTTVYADRAVVQIGSNFYRNETGGNITINNADATTLPTGAGTTWAAYTTGHPGIPGHANSDWGATIGNTFADIQTIAGFSEAAKFADQAAVDKYMTDEIYTEDNFLQSIMFVSMGTFTDLIERVADARAENGAEQNRLNMTNELLTQNQTNLEAAHGRIMDADIALESTRFARQNVLVQSSAAMVAQANQLTNIALTILG